MNVTDAMRRYSTLVAIKEMFGDEEFTEKQYSMIRELTGCHLVSIQTLCEDYDVLSQRRETIYLNADKNEQALFFDNENRAPLSVKEFNDLPKGVHEYIAKKGADVLGKVKTKRNRTSWRYKYKLKANAIENQKARIKYLCSDEAVAEIQQKIQRLVAQLEVIKDVLKTMED